MALGRRGDLGIVLGHLRDGTPRPRTVSIGDLLVWVVPTSTSYMGALPRVVGGIRSHLSCLFAYLWKT